jgi:hypothetical protein
MLEGLRRVLSGIVGVKHMGSVPSVAVYVTANEIFVISQRMTDNGRTAIEPMQRLERSATPAAVGSAVLAGLEAFQDGEGPPDPDCLQNLLDFVGARSWTPFAKRALNVSIAGRSGHEVVLSPARANGRGAYAYGDSYDCPRAAQAIGELLASLADKMAP